MHVVWIAYLIKNYNTDDYGKKENLSDQSLLKGALKGSWGVFRVTLAWSSKGKFVGIDKEVAQGKNIIAACLENKIAHFVLSTGLTYQGHEQIPNCKSKMYHVQQ